jgi:3-oxoacyl-[acyl-carrier protein] reductase
VDLGLEGRVALVMGASKGIGRGVALALSREGARVALASRSRERIDAAAQDVGAQTGGEAKGFVADASDSASLGGLVTAVEQELGSVDVLVTNTGGPPLGEPLALDRSDWEAAYRSLVLGPISLVTAAAPGMRERGWGRIVNITSSSTYQPIPGLMLSNAHRLAAVGAFKTLARELARDGVLLNSVAPGRIATDRIAQMSGASLEEVAAQPQPDVPVGRIGTVSELADVVAFLCSERASYLCGVNLLVDGGLVQCV